MDHHRCCIGLGWNGGDSCPSKKTEWKSVKVPYTKFWSYQWGSRIKLKGSGQKRVLLYQVAATSLSPQRMTRGQDKGKHTKEKLTEPCCIHHPLTMSFFMLSPSKSSSHMSPSPSSSRSSWPGFGILRQLSCNSKDEPLSDVRRSLLTGKSFWVCL